MKHEHEYLKTSLWYKEKIADPYQVIAEFFSAADLPVIRYQDAQSFVRFSPVPFVYI